jgi:hypothetical protein
MTYARYMYKFAIFISLLCLNLWMIYFTYMQGSVQFYALQGSRSAAQPTLRSDMVAHFFRIWRAQA